MNPLRLFLILFSSLSFSAVTAQDLSIFLRDLGPEKGQKLAASPESLPFPSYPLTMVRAGIIGDVTVRFLVHEDGSVSDATVLSTTQVEFSGPAIEAVGRWKFFPPRRSADQKPEIVWMHCTFYFKKDLDLGAPTAGKDFQNTRLSGHEVLELALGAVKSAGIRVDEFSGFNTPQIFVFEQKGRLMWAVTWWKHDTGENLRIWVDDSTREVKRE